MAARTTSNLTAGERIWLVSPAYAKTLEGIVPGGSLTNGAYGEVKKLVGHLSDILQSVTESPDHLDEVAKEYAQAIRDHLAEIVGIVAAFIMAEALSAFLAATPTGVGQIAAVIIQLALAAFGAAGMVQSAVDAVQHASQWLTLAWTADGKANQIAAASREFLKMLVSVAMAALAYAGVKANMGKALTIANSIPVTGMPALAVAGGRTRGVGGAATMEGVQVGVPSPAGPLGTAMSVGTGGSGSGGATARTRAIQTAAELEKRIEALGDEALMERLQKVDLDAVDVLEQMKKIERDVSIAEEGPWRGTGMEPGLPERPTPGKGEPARFSSGKFAHENLERLRKELGTSMVPPEYAAQLKSGEIISVDKLPDT